MGCGGETAAGHVADMPSLSGAGRGRGMGHVGVTCMPGVRQLTLCVRWDEGREAG